MPTLTKVYNVFGNFLGGSCSLFVAAFNQRMRPTLILYLLFFLQFSYAQKNITGVVRDSLGTVKNAHVINLNTGKGTVSNNLGEFEIMTSLGDELEITSVQHEKARVTVANITLKNRKIEIILKIKTYQLEEFQLKKTDLIGSLGIDLKDVPIDKSPKIDALSLGLPFAGIKPLSPIDRKIRTATSASGGIPLDFMLNVISGQLRKLKEEKRVIEENYDVEYIYDSYRFFIQDYYDIKRDDLYRFLYLCVEDPSYHRNMLKDELKMISFLKLISQKFKAILSANE